MKHELPDLPYSKNALEPHISAETLEYHWGKHHRKYVDTLNELISGTEFADAGLEDIVGNAGAGPIFNNAAQAWNHAFYWNCLSPEGGGRPQGAVAKAIDSSFGSFDKFRDEFSDAAKSVFGSGWAWLINTGNDVISIQTMPNAETPLMHGRIALLTCDMWEHAYYLDYRNDKGGYLDAFWKLVNWDFVNERLEA
ncbi:superoxide dismutase [Wenzhouxiangella sp. XN24]|uniref:superoxide dismutase n=1 Tax=Wenzhouxiangella sp. XN24 TaxID=2713569 RepID=UPI0013EB2DF9|nr:superoxide dismutase [Wenzhouxiangella sp. XN24]NGX15334.1 superoxide dismutase [Wenzhouxiangella sp. XN24]